ncbi:MAG TPA: glycosyltransferase family 1 protein, partial [Thermohalobaculum sp.]|nr:glycosyltransferase family 1 protein [Thermohalobaculum sp.]
MTRIAFYAPMKPPDHPNPSGDRHIARLTLKALALAGFDAECVSRLRSLDMAGDPAVQAQTIRAADTEGARLIAELRADPPALWFTYHCYYKAPDLLGPAVTRALGIPYAISEASVSPKRREGAWAGFAALSDTAISQADRLFWTTLRDRPGLEAAGHAAKMVHLPAFLDPGPAVAPRPAGQPLRLLTIAMMRPGDK